EGSRRCLDRAFLVDESAGRAVCGPDRCPQGLLTMQPARVPPARLVPSDVVPEGLDGAAELERLRAQGGASGRCVELQPKKTRLQVRQVEVAAGTARTD